MAAQSREEPVPYCLPAATAHALRFLNQSLAENVAAIDQLDVQTYGVLDSSAPMTHIIGTRIPPIIVANIDRLREAIAASGLIAVAPGHVPLMAQAAMTAYASGRIDGHSERLMVHFLYKREFGACQSNAPF